MRFSLFAGSGEEQHKFPDTLMQLPLHFLSLLLIFLFITSWHVIGYIGPTEVFASNYVAYRQCSKQFRISNDQYTFLATGSTTAALIALTENLTELLSLRGTQFVHLIAMRFTKAFDTVPNNLRSCK